MNSQEDPQGSPLGDRWNWEDQSVDDQVLTTLSVSVSVVVAPALKLSSQVSPSMTEKQYKFAEDKDSAKAAHFKTASIPNSLQHPHRNRKKRILGTMTGLSPSGSCLRQLVYDLKYPNGGRNMCVWTGCWMSRSQLIDSTSEYHPSPSSKHSLDIGQACDRIATGLASKTESDTVRSLMLSGLTAGVAQSLFDEQRNLVMTCLLELRLAKKVCQTTILQKCNLTQQSDSSTQASTIPPVEAENVQDTGSGGSDDAAAETDDEYPPGDENPRGDETNTDVVSPSDEEIYLQ
jgi:hypothetical protein